MILKTLQKYLPTCPSIDLWLYYCQYFHSQNTHLEDEKCRSDVDNVYKYALSTIGFFIDADKIWQSYSDFLKSIARLDLRDRERPKVVADRRKFYHQAVVIPMFGKFIIIEKKKRKRVWVSCVLTRGLE